MLFLVTGEFIEPGALLPPDQVVSMLEQQILSSIEILVRWEQEGRIRGGVFAGERAGAWVMEAVSSEEIGQQLATLPFWGLVKWHVRPLQTFRSTADRERQVAEQIKSAGGR
jgi:hypothetical protein